MADASAAMRPPVSISPSECALSRSYVRFILSNMTFPAVSAEPVADVSLIATPSLVIDGEVVSKNIRRMQHHAGEHHLRLRPHAKTHKSRRFAEAQIAAGACGLTVAKVGEAEVLADLTEDLLLAYPAVDATRCRRLALLAGERTVRVAVDSAYAVAALAGAAREAGVVIGILVDLDVGLGRTGVESPRAAVELAEAVERSAGLRLDGLFCYPGHVWQPPAEQGPALRAVASKLEETLDLWKKHGLTAEIVSGGSTPTAYQSHLIPQLTEVRPGTYIFNDMNTVRGGFCTVEDCAARIVCTVVSDAVRGKVVIDAGSKTLTSDRCIPAPDSGHGLIVEHPGAKITRLSEEHGEVDISGCGQPPKIGERVTVIPNHICPCINLQDSVWLRSDDGPLEELTIDARGRLS